jgi:general secretion pathway protein K
MTMRKNLSGIAVPQLDGAPAPQSGAALITALLLVVLVAGIVSQLLAAQSHALSRVVRAQAQTQLTLFATPSLDWARAALLEDSKASSIDHLGELWARGLPPQSVGGGVNAGLATGIIKDETAKFNVNNLVNDQGVKSQADVDIFLRLLADLGLDTSLAYAVLDWIDIDDELTYPGGAETATYMAKKSPYRAANRRMVQIEELLRVQGITQAIFNRLQPFVTALPTRTKINLNTAPQQLLSAVLPRLVGDDAKAFIKLRTETPFANINAVRAALKGLEPPTIDQICDVRTDYFEVFITVENTDGRVRLNALMQRPFAGALNPSTPAATASWPSIIWVRNF